MSVVGVFWAFIIGKLSATPEQDASEILGFYFWMHRKITSCKEDSPEYYASKSNTQNIYTQLFSHLIASTMRTGSWTSKGYL